MNWYKRAQQDTGIRFEGEYNVGGAQFVLFNIRGDYWAYKMSFPDWVWTVKEIARRSHGKALAWAKKKKSGAYKVTKDFPMPGSIIREEGEKEKE